MSPCTKSELVDCYGCIIIMDLLTVACSIIVVRNTTRKLEISLCSKTASNAAGRIYLLVDGSRIWSVLLIYLYLIVFGGVVRL